MTDQTPTPKLDESLKRFREYVTASIALVIIVGTIIMIIIAMLTSGDVAQSQRMKDLLLLVLPLTGTVLGYYFTKTSTETRAENAEYTAKTASNVAQQATQAQQTAQSQAVQAQQAVQELSQKSEAADAVMHEMDTKLGEADALLEKLEKSGAGAGEAAAGVSFGIGEEDTAGNQELLDAIHSWRRESERARIKAQALVKE